MRRGHKLIALILCYVLCISTLIQPMAIYASTLQVGDTSIEQQDKREQGTDETAGSTEDVESTESSSSGELEVESASNEALVERKSESAASSTSNQVEQDAITASDDTEDKELDKANSWRYKDGERIDVQSESDGISTYSMDTLPSCATAQGIDVSSWQGDIDWQKVKDAGIDFAIIRLGYWTNGKDKKLERNVAECERLGIPWGAYLYSYCSDPSQAAAEADHALDLLNQLKAKGYMPDLPVYFDMEDDDLLSGGRDFAGMATQFCNKIEAAGYSAGVYANKNWWTNYLTSSVFNKWTRWVAQYNSVCTYGGSYDAWQYTSSGSVPGISGGVDMNWWYGEPFGATLDDYKDVFDSEYYLSTYPDVREACGDSPNAALRHFIDHGMSEGRRGNESFDVASYYNANRDLREAFGRSLPRYYEHYIEHGKGEDRVCTGASEIADYATARGGTDYSPVYDGAYYRDNNPDVAEAYTVDFGSVSLLDDAGMLAHFVRYGMAEGRRASESFDVQYYRRLYPDLRGAFGATLQKYYEHYVKYGRFEGRVGSVS